MNELRASRRALTLAALTALLLLSAALRFHRLEVQSFWNDEGNSARLSERSIALIVEGTASDINPPLYYLLLHGWRALVGASEFGLRSLSTFLGLGIVALTLAWARALDSRRSVLMVIGLLAAVNPALIYYSQETRMYALLAFLALLATWLLVVWLTRLDAARASSESRRTWNLAAAYLLVMAAGLYTHYFFPVVFLVHGLIVASLLFLRKGPARPWRRPLITWLATALGALLLYLPWLPIFLRQAGGRSGGSETLTAFLADGGRWLAYGPTLASTEARWPLAALAVLLALGLIASALFGRHRSLGPVLALVAPLSFMWLTGTAQSVFYKFMLMGVPPLCLLLGRGWSFTSHFAASGIGRFAGRLTGAALLGLIGWGSLRALDNMYFDPAYTRADYRAIARQIAAENHPDAGIILNAANQWEVFTYYYQGPAPVYPLPRGFPDPAVIEPELETIAAQHERLYALFWGEAERDPQRLVERWLDAHAYKARDEWVGDVRFVTYALPAQPAADMKTAADLLFGDHITLIGYTLGKDHYLAGDILPLTLFWRTDEPLAERYKVFLHLVAENGQIVSQRDSEPGGLTTNWPPNQVIIDNHGLFLPLDLAAGAYSVWLGLYELTDPAVRLPIQSAAGVVDALLIGTIVVAME